MGEARHVGFSPHPHEDILEAVDHEGGVAADENVDPVVGKVIARRVRPALGVGVRPGPVVRSVHVGFAPTVLDRDAVLAVIAHGGDELLAMRAVPRFRRRLASRPTERVPVPRNAECDHRIRVFQIALNIQTGAAGILVDRHPCLRAVDRRPRVAQPVMHDQLQVIALSLQPPLEPVKKFIHLCAAPLRPLLFGIGHQPAIPLGEAASVGGLYRYFDSGFLLEQADGVVVVAGVVRAADSVPARTAQLVERQGDALPSRLFGIQADQLVHHGLVKDADLGVYEVGNDLLLDPLALLARAVDLGQGLHPVGHVLVGHVDPQRLEPDHLQAGEPAHIVLFEHLRHQDAMVPQAASVSSVQLQVVREHAGIQDLAVHVLAEVVAVLAREAKPLDHVDRGDHPVAVEVGGVAEHEPLLDQACDRAAEAALHHFVRSPFRLLPDPFSGTGRVNDLPYGDVVEDFVDPYLADFGGLAWLPASHPSADGQDGDCAFRLAGEEHNVMVLNRVSQRLLQAEHGTVVAEHDLVDDAVTPRGHLVQPHFLPAHRVLRILSHGHVRAARIRDGVLEGEVVAPVHAAKVLLLVGLPEPAQGRLYHLARSLLTRAVTGKEVRFCLVCRRVGLPRQFELHAVGVVPRVIHDRLLNRPAHGDFVAVGLDNVAVEEEAEDDGVSAVVGEGTGGEGEDSEVVGTRDLRLET